MGDMIPEWKTKFDELYLDQNVITFPVLNRELSDKEQLTYNVIPVDREVVEHIFAQSWKAAEENYKAQIEKLKLQLENWQETAIHGDEGL